MHMWVGVCMWIYGLCMCTHACIHVCVSKSSRIRIRSNLLHSWFLPFLKPLWVGEVKKENILVNRLWRELELYERHVARQHRHPLCGGEIRQHTSSKYWHKVICMYNKWAAAKHTSWIIFFCSWGHSRGIDTANAIKRAATSAQTTRKSEQHTTLHRRPMANFELPLLLLAWLQSCAITRSRLTNATPTRATPLNRAGCRWRRHGGVDGEQLVLCWGGRAHAGDHAAAC